MKFRIYILFLIPVFLLVSCENNIEPVPKSDYLRLPSASAEDFVTIMSDSGKMEVRVSAPLMEQWDSGEAPYTEFTKGIRVDYYDKDTIVHGSVTAMYAKYDKNSDIWTLRDSVVVINEDDDKLETELLNWDQKKDLIYTDRFVKITRIKTEEIIQGFGFESDSHLRRQKIKKVSATIYIDTEE
ncbi:MAG TPA: LPS export ABC transporter periplasmic protein LptC [Bacteroidales bacterium]|nr:LPS export ABC transporter periplasmic protein LptC [Bacteroidales bacterium]